MRRRRPHFNDIYIKIPAIYKKLKAAEENGFPLYLSAPVGYGKTSAIRYYYRKKSAKWLSGESGMLSEQPHPDKIKQQVVIIDDALWKAFHK